MSPEQVKEFYAEYTALCRKHGLMVSFDWGCQADEVTEPNEDNLEHFANLEAKAWVFNDTGECWEPAWSAILQPAQPSQP